MSGSSDSQESLNHFGNGPSSGSTQATITPDQIDLNQVYTLIDSILPFEACLYYQILPLSIEGSRLVMGTVNPDDRAASDYVKKQLSYINYSLTFRTIQSDWHRDLLSKYLSHNAKMRQRSQPQVVRPNESVPTEAEARKASPKPALDSSLQTTFIVDQPDEISDYVRSASVRGVSTTAVEPELSEALETTLPSAPEPLPLLDDQTDAASCEDESPTLISAATAGTANLPIEVVAPLQEAEDAPTVVAAPYISATDAEQTPPAAVPGASLSQVVEPEVSRSAALAAPVASVDSLLQPPVPSSPAIPSTNANTTSADPTNPVTDENTPPLQLQIDEEYRNLGEGQLANLAPKALMQALLGQILEEGIGRLYFERPGGDVGRILWSKDGILQAVLESIEPQIFQGVINEFKLLTHLSLMAVKKPKQVEIERMYGGERILLRFRVMPNAYGEEATLQILRGTALRFYQQQQIDKLGRDALDAAQTLNRRLSEMRDRARQTLNFKPTRSNTLPNIIQLLKQMEAQIQDLVAEHEQADKVSHSQSKKRL